MGRWGRITLEDMVTGLLRYVPAFATAAAIVAVVTLLPGKPDKSDMSRPRLQANTPLQQRASPTTTAPAPSTTRPLNTVRPGGAGSGDSTGSYGPVRSGGASSAGPSASSLSSAPSSSGDTASPDRSFGFEDDDEPLRIVATAWASRTAGSPLGSQGVPEGSLPVGTRLAQDDKRSFIRLEGDAMSLTLTEDSEGARDPAQGEAAVQACAITDGSWEEQEDAYSFDDAPAYDEERCVDGERADDGTWTFNLVTLGEVASREGLALVPGQDAPVDFQVAFEPFISPAG